MGGSQSSSLDGDFEPEDDAQLIAEARAAQAPLPPFLLKNELIHVLVADATSAAKTAGFSEALLNELLVAGACRPGRTGERTLDDLAGSLVANNSATGNLQALFAAVADALQRLRCVDTSKQGGGDGAARVAVHGLWVARCLLQPSLLQLANDGLALNKLLRGSPESDAWPRLCDQLLQSLVDLDPGSLVPGTTAAVAQVLATLVALCSTQLAHSSMERSASNIFLELLLTEYSTRASQVVTKLLRLVSFDAKPTAVPVPFSCSLPAEALSINSVRELAGILLCLLLNQRWRPKRSSPNAYRQALSRLQDQPGVLSFEDLWRYLQSEILHRREPALLLYALLAENASFESFVMARSDIDSLVLPMLQRLHREILRRKRHTAYIYILLIVLLILTQNESVNATLQTITVQQPRWLKERDMSKSNLSSLVVVVLLRTLQVNLSEIKDIYLQTTCVGILGNMARSIQHLHQYAAQRLVTFFDIVARRYHKIIKLGPSMKIDDDDMTMGIMVELLQLLLEIINVILIEQLKVNSRLVYVLLYQHDHITSFRSHATLGKLVTNIDSLLAFFSARLARPTGETLTSEETLEAIVAESHNWDQHRANSLVNVPPPSFGYEEESSAQDFFGPFAWTPVLKHPFFAQLIDPHKVTLVALP